MIAYLDGFQARALVHHQQTGRPLVTLSYAQSLDGCLTLEAGQTAPVSGEQSMVMTHRLRAAHDAVLIGIGTLLADDPRLTVRLADGENPQPVVLDSTLRCPSTARLLSGPRPPYLITTPRAPDACRSTLETAGARIVSLPADEKGRVDLPALLDWLGAEGITSLMVEGGAQVITSFLRARLADSAVITIAPVFAGGYHAVETLNAAAWTDLPRLIDPICQPLSPDQVIWGHFKEWETSP